MRWVNSLTISDDRIRHFIETKRLSMIRFEISVVCGVLTLISLQLLWLWLHNSGQFSLRAGSNARSCPNRLSSHKQSLPNRFRMYTYDVQ